MADARVLDAEGHEDRVSSPDLSRERADTRLLPGAKAVLEYRRRVDRVGLRARVSVVVYPDAFYTDFFESLLAQGAGRGEAQIREADQAIRSEGSHARRS